MEWNPPPPGSSSQNNNTDLKQWDFLHWYRAAAEACCTNTAVIFYLRLKHIHAHKHEEEKQAEAKTSTRGQTQSEKGFLVFHFAANLYH